MATVTLLERRPGDIEVWIDALVAGYIDERITAGESEAVARETTASQMATFFNEGDAAPGHHVFEAFDESKLVGHLWIGMRSSDDPTAWWVYFVETEDDVRGRGYGRAVMEAGEAEAMSRGATTLGLNVFGANVVARGLYERLGYEVTTQQMRKQLPTH